MLAEIIAGVILLVIIGASVGVLVWQLIKIKKDHKNDTQTLQEGIYDTRRITMEEVENLNANVKKLDAETKVKVQVVKQEIVNYIDEILAVVAAGALQIATEIATEVDSYIASLEQRLQSLVNEDQDLRALINSVQTSAQTNIEDVRKSLEAYKLKMKTTEEGVVSIGARVSAIEKNVDPRFKSIGRGSQDQDWFRIYGTKSNGTALYNGLAINDNGGLAVGSWEKVPQGELRIRNTDGQSSHFNYLNKGENYIRGKTQMDGDILANGKFQTKYGLQFTTGDPGPMVEKNYGKQDDRYGVGQFAGGAMRVYSASSFKPATLNLSMAKADGTFNDVLTIDNNKNVQIRGSTNFDGPVQVGNKVKANEFCINTTCLNEAQLKKLQTM